MVRFALRVVVIITRRLSVYRRRWFLIPAHGPVSARVRVEAGHAAGSCLFLAFAYVMRIEWVL